jgi:hypothetical protein
MSQSISIDFKHCLKYFLFSRQSFEAIMRTDSTPSIKNMAALEDAPNWVTRIEKELILANQYDARCGAVKNARLSRKEVKTAHTVPQNGNGRSFFNLISSPNGNPLLERPKSPYSVKNTALHKITAMTERNEGGKTQIDEVQRTRSFNTDLSEVPVAKIHADLPQKAFAYPATSSHEIGWYWKSCEGEQSRMIKLQRTLNN